MEQTQEKISAWYLANCGVLLEYQDHQILIDGLFKRPPQIEGENADVLCTLPEGAYRDLLDRKPPFAEIELLLFTHLHWDHCDIADANAYSARYQIPLLCVKEDGSDYTYENDWVRIENLSYPHDVPSNGGNLSHSCFRVELAGKVFLFTGDLDATLRPVRPELYEKKPDYLFYNVHHLLRPEGRQLVSEYIKPGRIFIQHLPNIDHDPYQLHKRIANKLRVYENALPPCTVLDTPMTRIL